MLIDETAAAVAALDAVARRLSGAPARQLAVMRAQLLELTREAVRTPAGDPGVTAVELRIVSRKAG